MCGIVGIMAGNVTGQHARMKYFEQALYADALRGWDSTGIFAVSRNKDVDIFKRAVTATDFMTMAPYDTVAKRTHQHQFLIGHNRKATKGGISHNNAHPFDFGNVVMVHNGTLDNHKTLPDGNSFIVDSEALAHSINEIGPIETFEQVEGAFAVVWYDYAKDTLNLIRNEERPLCYAYVENGVLLASEKFMLIWLANRNSIELKEVFDLPPGVMVSFKSSDIHNPVKTTIDIKEPYYNKWCGYGANKKRTYSNTHTVVQQPSSNIITLPNDTARETEQKRSAIQALRLTHHGLKLKETICIDTVGFTPYDKCVNDPNPNGCIDGLYATSGSEEVLVVEIHGQKQSDYLDGVAYSGTVQALRIGDTPMNDIVILVNAEPMKVPDESKIGGDSKTITKKETLTVDKKGAANDNKAAPRFQGPSGRFISKDTFDTLTQDGCVYCGGFINPDFASEIGWVDVAHGGGACCHVCYPDYRDLGVFYPSNQSVH